MRRSPPRSPRVLVLAMVALLGVAACSPGGEQTATQEPDRAGGGAAPERDAAGVEEDAAPPADELPTAADRQLIRTAHLTLESSDPEATVREVREQAGAVEGFVSDTNLRRDESGVLSGTVTLRVPAGELDATVEALTGLPTVAGVPSQRLETRDVTTQVADIEARLRNLRAVEDELRGLLADVREDTQSAEQLLQIFSRLQEIRGEIERLEARQSALGEQVALATINVTVQPVAGVREPGGAAEDWAPGAVARDALEATRNALQAIASGLIWVALTGLPLLAVTTVPLLLVGWGVLRWWRRRSAVPTPRGQAAQAAQATDETDEAGDTAGPPATR